MAKARSLENPNRYNSTVVQSLLELAKLDTVPHDFIDKAVQLAIFLNENDRQLVKTIDGIVKKKEYNNDNITWYRHYFSEIPRLLSANANIILTLMCNVMAQGNLVQLSWQNIIDGTSIKSKKSIQTAIKELLNNGCIAIKFQGDKRNATVYMVNPDIAIVGKTANLHNQFWELINQDEFNKWYSIKHDITYSREIVKRTDTDKGNNHKCTFGKMGPPPEEIEESAKPTHFKNDKDKNTSGATTTPDANKTGNVSNDEELPFAN